MKYSLFCRVQFIALVLACHSTLSKADNSQQHWNWENPLSNWNTYWHTRNLSPLTNTTTLVDPSRAKPIECRASIKKAPKNLEDSKKKKEHCTLIQQKLGFQLNSALLHL